MVTTTGGARTRRPMDLRTLRTFIIATFALSWGVGVLLSIFPDQVEAMFGPMGYTNPAFVLLVYGPGIVGVVLVARYYGLRGLGRFLLGVVAISVILTAMFNAARGSLLVAVLFHAQVNAPAWPDAQPWDMYLFVVVAVVVVVVDRTAMLSRGAAATDVLPGSDEATGPGWWGPPVSVPRDAAAADPTAPWLPPRPVVRVDWYLHRATSRATGGRVGLRRPSTDGWGTLQLTTMGCRTGELRPVLVGYIEDGPDFVTMAMNGWAEPEPAWWLNLQAHPLAHVDQAGGHCTVRARAATGVERERLWARWRSVNRHLDVYAARRPSPTAVIVLEVQDQVPGGEVTRR